MARRRRKARKNPRRRARRLRRNPRRRARRLRRNPGKGVFARAAPVTPKSDFGVEVAPGLFAAGPIRKPRKKKGGRKLSAKTKRRRRLASKLRSQAIALRKRARGMKRGMRKSVAYTQARRLNTLARVARRGGSLSKSPVYKAMHVKANPGVAGVVAAAKVLAPQAAVGAGAMFGLGFVGKLAADKVREMAGASLPASIHPYVPAISTALLTGVGYVVADKVAPKFKGAVAIGGLIGAIVQGVVAASASAPDSFLGKAKSALLGDYTLVGGRSYAEAGIFREIGDYTTVGWHSESREGGAYSNARPRNFRDNGMEIAMNGLGWHSESRDGGAYSNARPRNYGDNRTEYALNGLDDNTEFAPGEGGVLSGGLFRGPTSR